MPKLTGRGLSTSLLTLLTVIWIDRADPSPTPSPSPQPQPEVTPESGDRPGLPAAPQTGTPQQGNVTPGAVRHLQSCLSTQHPLTALMAHQGRDFTRSAYPTLWFYVPYAPDQISRMEFILLNERETQTVWRTQVQSSQIPGFLSVSLPLDPQYGLSQGPNYRWYFMVDCAQVETEEPDLVVDGWIQRIPPESDPGQLSYDAIHDLAYLYQQEPESSRLNQRWRELLNALGQVSIPDRPLVRSTLVDLNLNSFADLEAPIDTQDIAQE